MKYLKRPLKYLTPEKTNHGKMVKSRGTKKKIAEKEKLKDQKLKDKSIP
jgi:hypothetical protein